MSAPTLPVEAPRPETAPSTATSMPLPAAQAAPSDGGVLPDETPTRVVARLSTMMALEYGSIGVWSVTCGTYISANTTPLGQGIFASGFVGLCATATAAGSLMSPVLIGFVADRWFSAEKLLALLHGFCALCLFWMASAGSQLAFYAGILLFYQSFAATITLTTSIALRHLPDAAKQFPPVRAFGSVGWIAAGLFVGFAWPYLYGASIEDSNIPMKIGVAIQAAMAIYCLTLPKTPPLPRLAGGWGAVARGTSLWRRRSFLIFLAVSVLVCMPSQFYSSFINVYLNNVGFAGAAGKMTLGQLAEIACMMSMPLLLGAIGLKRLFMIGLLAWNARFAMLAFGDPATQPAWVYIAIVLHGISYTFVYIVGQLYVDRLAAPHNRAAAQGMLSIATLGVGHLSGALLSGLAQSAYLTPPGDAPPIYDWSAFWLVPFLISLAAPILFICWFRDDRVGEPAPQPSPAAAPQVSPAQ